MMGKTHIAVGIASAYILMQPKTPTEFVVATVGGSIGGVMADIDVKIDTRNVFARKATMDAPYGEALAIALSSCAIAADFLLGGDIVSGVIQQRGLALAGVALLVGFVVFGRRGEHRDRTHSILAQFVSTVAVSLIDVRIAIAYSIGYASHLLIDLLNKKGIRLLYPMKKTFCFKVCYADRLGNEALLIVGVCIIALFILLHGMLPAGV